MLNLLRRLADNRRRGSFANRLRQRRFRLFRALVDSLLQDLPNGPLRGLPDGPPKGLDDGSYREVAGEALRKLAGGPPKGLDKGLPRPLKVIDVGGTEDFWRKMGITGEEGLEITLLNLSAVKTELPGFVGLAGDARNMSQFPDQAFDVAFSNSVIEHVGGWADQQAMAAGMRRVGKRIFLQTPNRNFPIEPHFLFPFFQFLPVGWRIWLLMHFRLGWYPRHAGRESALQAVESVRLLTRHELRTLFPGATIVRERFMGLTKSFVVVG